MELGVVPNGTFALENFTAPIWASVDVNADENTFTTARNSGFMVFWRIFFTLLAGITGALAGAKLIAYWRTVGLELSVGQVILWLQFFASLFRACYAAIDPIYQGYTLMAGYQAHWIYSIHFPINIITTLLLSLYWKELMDSTKVTVAGFLSKMKIPFFLLSLFVVAIEVACDALRASESSSLSVAIFIYGAAYIATLLLSSAFFFFTGARVIGRLREASKAGNVHGSSHKQILRRVRPSPPPSPRQFPLISRALQTTVYLFASAIFNVIWVSGLIQALFDTWFFTPVGQIFTFSCMLLGVYGAALAHVLSVKMPLSLNQDSSRNSGVTDLHPPTSPRRLASEE